MINSDQKGKWMPVPLKEESSKLPADSPYRIPLNMQEI